MGSMRIGRVPYVHIIVKGLFACRHIEHTYARTHARHDRRTDGHDAQAQRTPPRRMIGEAN